MHNGKTVLIVDDSVVERHQLREMMQALGMVVHEASSGEEGIAKAAEIKPNIILMDVVMPGLNGFQATREITKSDATKHIPVVMCTSKGQETDKVWGKRQGASGYLIKPVVKEDLSVILDEVLK